MSNYAAALLTPATIAAGRYAQQEQPILLRVAMNRATLISRDHQNADEVASLAQTIVAGLLPPSCRLGYGPSYAATIPEDEYQPIATTAARTACQRAAVAIAKDYRDMATLDALTASDPNALDRLAESDARLTLSRYAPDPQTAYGTTAADRLAAALVAVHPEHAEAIETAAAAWTDDARSLAAAVAMHHGWTNASKERRTYARRLAAALDDLAPLAGRITENPHGRSTEQTDARTPTKPGARPTTARTMTRTAPATVSAYWTHEAPSLTPEQQDAADLTDTERERCGYWTERRTRGGDTFGQRFCTRTAGHDGDHLHGPALLPSIEAASGTKHAATLPAATTTTAYAAATATGTGRAALAARLTLPNTHRTDCDRQHTPPSEEGGTPCPTRWTPEPTGRTRPAWTDEAASLAAARIERPGALAQGTFDPAATDPSIASHVIVRLADRVEVRDATDGHTIATRPLDEYAALMEATRQPVALEPRHRDALAPGLPDQERAERRAAQPTPGPVKKPSSRKKAGTGAVGPTIPARF